MKKLGWIFIVLTIVISFTSCDDDFGGRNGRGGNVDFEEIQNETGALPLAISYPSENLYSPQKEELGRLLFWDPIMSGGKDIACASCHHPQFAYADGRELSQGINGIGLGPNRQDGNLIKRNSPTILNTAFNGIENNSIYNPEEAPMFWDNRALSLEEQSIMPMLDKDEMRGQIISEDNILDTIIQRLNNINQYLELFEAAFGTTEITETRIMESIATFERSIISNNSRFDQYMRGEQNVLTDEEIEGMQRFIEVGCANCHSGSMFSDFELHTIGVPGNGIFIDDGANGEFDFRTPTLRNVELTAPYMHNGEFQTLDDVVEFYEDISDGENNAINDEINFNQIAEEARDLNLNGGDIDEIVAFLKTLTDTNFDMTIPEEVPSKLAVGGNID